MAATPEGPCLNYSTATASLRTSSTPAGGVRIVAAPASDTRWIVRGSEGADAIAFLGPLSGRPLYTKHYPDDAVEFAERLGPSVAAEIASLWDEATSAG